MEKSKVAVCPICDNMVMASLVSHLSKESEAEFTEFSNEGFVIKIEPIERTKKRGFSDYKGCLKHINESFKTQNS